MTDNKNQKSSGVNPLIIGAVGAAVGAAAVVLSDEKNRQKVMDKLTQAGEQVDKMKVDAADRLEGMKSQAEDVGDQVEGKAEEMIGQAKDLKEKAEKKVEEVKKNK